MSNFSATQEAGQGVAPCDESIVPILPLRYTLTADCLLQMTQFGKAAQPIITVRQHPDHELQRLRQGFVFIYAEDHVVDDATDPQGRWQIFRYTTSGEDANSRMERSDTEIFTQGSHYSFKKYHWTDGVVGGQWELLPNERSYPYCFVSDQVSKVWIAYSEFRWPEWFFTKMENDATFRDSLMVSIDVAAKTGQHVASLSELAALSPAFTDGEGGDSPDDLGDALRQNALVTAPMRSVARCQNSRENGVLVGLYDPVGEHLDMATTAFNIAQTKQNFAAEHQYPMTIGKAVRQVRTHETRNDNGVLFRAGLWPSGFNSGVLNESFDRDLSRMESTLRQLDETERTMLTSIRYMESRTSFSATMYLINAALDEAAQLSGALQEDCVAFAANIVARAHHLVGASGAGTEHLLYTINGQSTTDYAKAVQNTLKVIKDLLEGAKNLHQAFLPAFNAVLTVYAKEWALSQTGHPRAITEMMFSRTIGRFNSAGELSTEFERVLNQEWGGVRGQTIGLDTISGEIETGYFRLTDPTAREIGAVSYYARVEFLADGEVDGALRRMQNADLAANGLGLVAGFLSLYTTVQAYGNPNRGGTVVGRAAQDPTVQIIAAFGDAFSAVHGIGTNVGLRSTAASRAALQTVFGGSMRLAGAVRINVAAGNWALQGMRLAVRAAGVLGAAISLAMAVDGFFNNDIAAVVGNGLMFVGAVALLFASGIGALIAVVVIIVGFLVSLFSNSDGENWVNRSFWGNSRSYWNQPRIGIDTLKEQAKVLAYPEDPNYDQIRAYLDEELAAYIDMFSQLELKNPVAGDRLIEIHCGVIQTPGDISKITVESTYDGWTSLERDSDIVGPHFVAPGIATVQLNPPAGTQSSDWSEVWIRVTIPRTPNGRFRESEKYSPAEV